MKEIGFCEQCNVFIQCPWFCSKEKDKNNNPIEPCFSREFKKRED